MLEQYFEFKDNCDRFQDYNTHQIWAKDMLQDFKFVWAGPDVSPHANFWVLLRFHWTTDHIISICLIFPYCDPLPLIICRSYRTASLLFSYPLSPHIFNRPLHYLVAGSLSLYQCRGVYLVRYIDPQSGGTVGLGLCPLCSLTLTRSESSCSI